MTKVLDIKLKVVSMFFGGQAALDNYTKWHQLSDPHQNLSGIIVSITVQGYFKLYLVFGK